MAIRFQCPSCAQPIEVDDVWASKPVICPYCSQTVTAPSASTFPSLGDIPTASTLSGAPVSSRGGGVPSPPTNLLAVIAFVFILGSVALLLSTELILRPHIPELQPLIEAAQKAESLEAMIRVQNEFYRKQGGVPPWLTAAVVMMFGGSVAWISAVVCGLIALRRATRRKLAVAALLIAGVMPVVLCCGSGLGSSAGG